MDITHYRNSHYLTIINYGLLDFSVTAAGSLKLIGTSWSLCLTSKVLQLSLSQTMTPVFCYREFMVFSKKSGVCWFYDVCMLLLVLKNWNSVVEVWKWLQPECSAQTPVLVQSDTKCWWFLLNHTCKWNVFLGTTIYECPSDFTMSYRI